MTLNPMTFDTYAQLKPYFQDQRYPLCTYSLPSIIAWTNDNFSPGWTVMDGALVVGAEFRHPKDSRHLILPVSPGKEFAPEELRGLAEELGFDNYWFVGQDYLDRHGREAIEARFTIEPQDEYADYVYHARDLAELGGSRYAKKRNLIKQFMNSHVDDGRVELAPIKGENAEECADFVEEWCAERDCDADPDNDLACEKQAILNTLAHIDDLDVRGMLLRVDGELSALAVAADLTATMGVLHFEKAFSHIKGLYQYFDQQCAQRLFNGHVFINKESDMGVPGLAKAKKSYHPAMLVESFKLTLK